MLKIMFCFIISLFIISCGKSKSTEATYKYSSTTINNVNCSSCMRADIARNTLVLNNRDNFFDACNENIQIVLDDEITTTKNRYSISNVNSNCLNLHQGQDFFVFINNNILSLNYDSNYIDLQE